MKFISFYLPLKVATQRIMTSHATDLLDIEAELLQEIQDEVNHVNVSRAQENVFKRSRTRSITSGRRLGRDSKLGGLEINPDEINPDNLSDVSSASLPSLKVSLSKISKEFNEGISTIMDKLTFSLTILPLSK